MGRKGLSCFRNIISTNYLLKFAYSVYFENLKVSWLSPNILRSFLLLFLPFVCLSLSFPATSSSFSLSFKKSLWVKCIVFVQSSAVQILLCLFNCGWANWIFLRTSLSLVCGGLTTEYFSLSFLSSLRDMLNCPAVNMWKLLFIQYLI